MRTIISDSKLVGAHLSDQSMKVLYQLLVTVSDKHWVNIGQQ